MIIAYIAHPVGGDIENNLNKIKAIVREVNLNEPDVVPFAPYYLDCLALDDNNPSERERGIKNDVELIKRGFINQLRLYGNRISNGMKAEIELCKELGIDIVPMTTETKNEYKKI